MREKENYRPWFLMVFTWDRCRKSAEFGGRRRGRGRSHLRTGNRKIAIDLWEDKLRSSFIQFFWVCFFFLAGFKPQSRKKVLRTLELDRISRSPWSMLEMLRFAFLEQKGKGVNLFGVPKVLQGIAGWSTWIAQLIFPQACMESWKLKIW